MKTNLMNILKTFVFIALLGTTGAFADAASFDTNPSGNTGITSIIEGDCSSCGGQETSVNLSGELNNSGDTVYVTVFTDFMAQRGSTQAIESARGKYFTRDALNQSSSSFEFTTRLSASNANSISDSVMVNGLPDSYNIEYVSGHIENSHGGNNGCPSAYNYNIDVDNSLFGSGDFLGNLTNENNGWCAQGTIAVKYKITNTEDDIVVPDEVEVDTNNASSVGTNSAQLNGEVVSGDGVNTWFRYSTSSSVSCNSGGILVDGPNNQDAGDDFDRDIFGLSAGTTYYFRACGQNATGLSTGPLRSFTTDGGSTTLPEVDTNNATSVDEDSATLNGEVEEGDDLDVWFRYSTNSNVTCNSGTFVDVSGSYDDGDDFSANISGLNDDTTYYFRACAEDDDGNEDQGPLRQFTTEDIFVQPTDIEVDTNNATSVDEDSATLNGEVEEGDDLDVWFRYSTNSNVTCNSGTFVDVSGSYDDGDDFSANISGLNDDTTYYFRACAEDDDGNEDQGPLRSFTTDGDQPANLDVDTLSATNVEQTSSTFGTARLRGEVTSGTSQLAYFVVSTSSSPSCFSSPQTPANNFDTPYSSGDDFYYIGNTYFVDTTYYYRACVSANGVTAQGDIREFRIEEDDDGEPGSDDRPEAETKTEDNLDENSADLKGRIKMNDFNNGIVFFVYGEDESQIENVASEYDSYDEAKDNEDGDDFRVKLENDDNDEDGWRTFTKGVNGLENDKKHYYQICVEYEKNNGDDDVVCGGVEEFRTDDDDSDNNNNNNNNESDINTDPARNINRTSARMCGEITDDGGSSVQSWIEFRRSNESQFNQTPIRQRGEVAFCEDVSGLQPNTNYRFRACTPDRCGVERNFRTLGDVVTQGKPPIIFTETPTNIRSTSATLNSKYVANAPSATCWFDYGRTQALGKRTRSYNVNGLGQCPHNFTNLASGTQYCVQAVIETQYGSDRGNITCFNTPRIVTGGPTPTPQPPVVVVEDDNEDLDLGLGLSLIRLEIDDDEEVVTRGENLEYTIEWENISELDLEDLELEVTIPQEIQITDISRGRLDADSNKIYFTIDELDGADYENNIPGDRGQMTVTGVVGRGTVGNLLTADAEIVYENPVNRAREDARDFDLDEYGAQIAGVTASVFGLSNITFLGWLVIALGLFIIFLVARWLYLEREELRAQAYLTGGYGSNGYGAPRMPVYRDPAPRYDVPPAAPHYNVPAAPQNVPQAPAANDYYEPYRPNRG